MESVAYWMTWQVIDTKQDFKDNAARFVNPLNAEVILFMTVY